MKMMKNKKYIRNYIAAVMIGCIALSDLSLATRITCTEDVEVDYEQHNLETYYADGNYTGKDSSLEITNGDNDCIDEYEKLSCFNILEIVRGEGLGTIGYSLDGFEPVPGDTPEMKHACMDALLNRICGGDQNESKNELPNYVNNFLTQFSDGEKKPFSTEYGLHTGYYKYVGEGKGYYSVVKGSVDKKNHKAKMVSKFYSGADSDYKNDYIWVNTGELVASDAIDLDNDIVVTEHRKINYVNKDVFFKYFYTPQEYNESTGEYKSGISVDEWKKTHKIQLRTVVCTELSDNDIEWADFIYISNGNGVYAQSAYELYKKANPGKTLPDRNNLPALNFQNFQQTLKIYDRVAVREDVAILVDGKDSFTGGKINTNYMKLVAMLFLVNNVKTAEKKKYGSGRDMFMDFMKTYVENGKAPGLRTTAVSNKMNGLAAENGYMYQDFPRQQVDKDDWHDDSDWCYFDINRNRHDTDCYFQKSKSNTTDYIYINEENGNFMVDTKYSSTDDSVESGKWVYWVDFEVYNNGNKENQFAHRYVSWTKQSDKLGGKNDSVEWPWDIVEGSCLKYWWVDKDVTDQQVHLPLYFQYYGDDYSWGPYRAISDPVQGTYKNQSFSQENGAFKGDLVKDAIAGRKNKREYTDPDHTVNSEEATPHYYFLSANIENGDGVNITEKGNKVLYINDYELDAGLDKIPINFVVRTSEDIKKIEVIKTTGATESVIMTYNPASTNDITKPEANLSFSGAGTLSLKNETEYTEGTGDSRKPSKDAHNHGLYIYKFSSVDPSIQLKLSDLKPSVTARLKTNSKIKLRIYVEPVKNTVRYIEDEIIIVKRDFFTLN